MKATARILTASALACALGMGSGIAHALTCIGNWYEAPRDGERGVPTNTLIWNYGRFNGAPATRLIGPDGEVPLDGHVIPVAIATPQGTYFPVHAPRTELEPNTGYVIEVGNEGDDGWREPIRFWTGNGPATAPPPLPELLSIEAGAGVGWEGATKRWLSLVFRPHGSTLIADTAGVLGNVSSVDDLFSAGAEFDTVVLESTTRAIRWMAAGDELLVGLGDCLIWPPSGQDRQTARFGLLDLAGNFSGWTTTELVLPSHEEALALIAAQRAGDHNVGCRFAPAAGTGASGSLTWLAALSFAALLILRRR